MSHRILGLCACRHFVQSKTGQDLPKDNMDAALEEVVSSYKSELGLNDKEAYQLEHLQVRHVILDTRRVDRFIELNMCQRVLSHHQVSSQS